jgi:hypothetical protein
MCLIVDICANQRLILDGVSFEMRGLARAGNGQIQDLFTYLDTQLPLAYVHVISVIVKFNMFLFAVHTGVAAAAFRYKNQHNASGDKEVDMVADLPVQIPSNTIAMLAICIIFQSCLELHRKLRNPFFGDTASFPEVEFHEKLQDQLTATQYVTGGCRLAIDAACAAYSVYFVHNRQVTAIGRLHTISSSNQTTWASRTT